jgi:hypothetical protein
MHIKDYVPHTKAPRIILILSFLLITILVIHFNILKFQHQYQLKFGGTGDREYFSNDNFGPEFGVKNFLLWVRFQWIRPMGKGIKISLPQSFQGNNLFLSFNILNRGKREQFLEVMNYKNDTLGFLPIASDNKFKKYQIEINTQALHKGSLNIKVGNAENPEKVTKLQIEKLEIFSEKGSSLPWKINLLFLFAILFIFCVILIGGFNLYSAIIGSIAASLFLTVIRYIDVLVYIKYIKSFLLAAPFLLIAVLSIRFLLRKVSIFSGESHKTLLILFFSVFIVHFLGQFYLYHFHHDVELRISYFRVLEEGGIGEYTKQVSPSQLEATGAKEGVMPYPPWYNLIALPFVKLGFDTDFWLRFQFILLSTLFPFAIYALTRGFSFTRNEARWSSFLSIFFMVFLDNLFFNAYDRMLAFLVTIIFLIFWFKTMANPQKIKMKKCAKLGILLGIAFVLHPSIPFVLSLFMFISFLYFLFNPRVKSKQLTGKIILIYCIGLAVSMIIFYGPFMKEVLTKTIPSAVTAEAAAKNNGLTLSSFSSMLLQISWRIIRYTPLIILPIVIFGFSEIRRKLLKLNHLNINSLYIWIITYLLLVFLRFGPILKNVFIWIQEPLFIYPLVSVMLGLGICNLLNSNRKTIHPHYSKMIKSSALLAIGIWAAFNLYWFYAVRIGMIRAAGYLPKWLMLFA